MRAYTSTALSVVIGRDLSRLHYYVKHGVFPKTPYTVVKYMNVSRYYTFDQMRVVKETFHDLLLKGNHEAICRRIMVGWAILGVPMGEGLDFDTALRLSCGSDDCEAIEKEFLIRAWKAKQGKDNGKAESGVGNETWYYLPDDSGKKAKSKKGKRRKRKDAERGCELRARAAKST